MDRIENHIDELIGKHISGEASPKEVAAVENWIALSAENRRYYDQMRFIFNRAVTITERPEFDTDQAWVKMKQKLAASGNGKTQTVRSINTRTETSDFNFYFRVAALAIIVIGLGFFAYRFFLAEGQPVEVIAEAKTTADTLPDGSGVYLNKETKLAYEFNKAKQTHVVKLQGEAYFNIKHNDDKKFIVKTDEVFIRDIGTSFNVKAYPESSTIEVVVEEGEVMFYSETDSGVYLKANGKGVYNKITKKFTVEEPEPNVTAYKTKFFIFSDTDLGTVVNTVNEVYTEQLAVGNHLKGCRLTVTFNNETPEEIATVIAETLGLRVKRSGHLLTLEGASCE